MEQNRNGQTISNAGHPSNQPNNLTPINLPPYMAQTSNSATSQVIINDQNRFQSINNTHIHPSPLRDSSANVPNFRYPHMVGRIVQLGRDQCTIKGDTVCENKELFALECQRMISGYNGLCPKCNAEHVKISKTRGFYVDVASVNEALGQQEMEKVRLQGRKKPEQLFKINGNVPPLDHPICGKNKGIEGDSNSCYMDATIFCMFAYSNIFDTLLYMEVTKESSRKVQTLLKENIVNLLRSEQGYVERDALFCLRQQLSEATGDKSFEEVEKDPSEFLRALEELFNYAPVKTIPPDQPPNKNQSNITINIIWEMFDANPENLLSTKIADIFRNSLSEIPAKLATIPPFLILIAPRHARSKRSYSYIIPDRHITLDNTLIQLVCFKCGRTNHGSEKRDDFYSCFDCLRKEQPLLTKPSTDASVVSYCMKCMKEMHCELGLENGHKPKPMKEIAKLNLFAVLCIELAHYVAFVKCHKTNEQHEWIFFDSMSDRIHNQKYVPCASHVPDFDRWIDEAEQNQFFFEDLDRRRKQGKPTSQTFSEAEMKQLRLFRDGAFLFYENSAVDY